MKLIIDEKIPFAQEAFSTLGEVVLCDGRKITSSLLSDAQILVTRSITQVNQVLLQNSQIQFVATATSGTDHIDHDYLQDNHIGFASSKGSNAQAVAEYVISCLLFLAEKKQISLSGKKIGIIGVGCVGKNVAILARKIGLQCLLNDPIREKKENSDAFVSLEEIAQKSDIVTIHTPLTQAGEFPTKHLINNTFFQQLSKKIILFNAARGGVIDEKALHKHAQQFEGLVFDVWENEPIISKTTLELADIATSHIAGYTLEGKINATEMAYQSICQFLQIEPQWSSQKLSLVQEKETIYFLNRVKTWSDVFPKVCNLLENNFSLKKIYDQKHTNIYFDQLRNQYTLRREFNHFCISANQVDQNELLQNLEFSIFTQ
ncbi:MAG: erythronate-4-phosphate dehydrogenase [bacterium]|jgi:erythronate-4-phosphate dehydrogenase